MLEQRHHLRRDGIKWSGSVWYQKIIRVFDRWAMVSLSDYNLPLICNILITSSKANVSITFSCRSLLIWLELVKRFNIYTEKKKKKTHKNTSFPGGFISIQNWNQDIRSVFTTGPWVKLWGEQSSSSAIFRQNPLSPLVILLGAALLTPFAIQWVSFCLGLPFQIAKSNSGRSESHLWSSMVDWLY